MQANRGPTSSSSRLFQLILFLCFLTNAHGTKHPPSFSSTDDHALLAFKSKSDLHNSLPFNASSPHCHWLGITCATVSDGTTRVIKLILENLPLTGPIPPNTLTHLDQLRILSLKNSSLTGPIPDLSGLINLKILFLSHNSFTGHFPPSISSLHRLRTIDLSHNNFTGTLPSFLTQLDRLTYLRLESNHFSGSLPPLNQSSLTTFNISFNNLSGLVPITTTFVRFGHSAFIRNPSLCGEIVHKECRPKIPFFSPTASEPTTAAAPGSRSGLDQNEEMSAAGVTLAQNGVSGNRNSKKRVVLGFVIGVLGLITALLCFTFAVKRSRRKKNLSTNNDGYYHQHEHGMSVDRSAAADAAEVMRIEAEREEKVKTVVSGMKFPVPAVMGVEDGGEKVGRGGGGGGSLVFCAGEERLYTVEQLMRGSAELLGRGTMGTTYKAVLDNRLIVCVKRLDGSKMSDEGKEAFERHMEAVGGLRHPNLVPLRAYFQAKEERLLVYDYQPNGSLFSLIHGSKSARAKPLHWTPCLKIAEDVAQGLSYIHQAWRLVHGNLKSSNILLGPDFEACLTDYCLTPLANDSAFLFNNNSQTDPDSSSSTAYRSPEIRGSIHEATSKSDVYAFGVLLLELLSGKPPHQHPYLAPREIVKWVSKVRGHVNGTTAHIGEDDDEEESKLAMLLEVALTCSVSSPEQRPTMWQVLKMLQEIKEAAALVEDHDCDSDPNSTATAPP